VSTDRNTLNLAAAVLCGIGSFVALLSALFTRGRRDRAALLSGLLGTIGSAAWAMAAYDDMLEANEVELSAATT
jgi:hypothetical protein